MFDFTYWLIILLLFARMTAFLAAAPFFSIRNVPPQVKGALGLLLAVLLFPAVKRPQIAEPEFLAFALLLAGEVLVGLALGYISTLVFSSIKMAGQLIDVQIGLAMAGLFDPQSGSQNTLLGQFLHTLGILLFMIMDGHHSLLLALAKSYELVPLAGFGGIGASAVKQVVEIFAGAFLLGLKIAAPVLAVLIMIDVALGLVARTVPQLNVFILGFPLKIGIGIVTLALLTPLLASVLANVFSVIERDLLLVMRSL
ncbi:flagellar biosynthetic protein FliR [Zhaonella formicivorans]|uniref:flagellar biosynthetic protein FliR n=1 Tax=Zhaonella formicivorans TaxID=2528593 RepID=UPI0010EF363A|nr:flagellar biosynthetic protein FliR [Zhaonella formicivorans]